MSEFQTSLIEEVRNLEADMDQMKEAEDKILVCILSYCYELLHYES